MKNNDQVKQMTTFGEKLSAERFNGPSDRNISVAEETRKSQASFQVLTKKVGKIRQYENL